MNSHDIKNLPSEVIDKINELNKDLNPEQKQGAETLFGPTMLIAGAGAGKTNTLTHRAATMIEAGISPLDLLIVTFTNKASTELKERLEKMIGENAHFITAGTFHSICFREMLSNFKDSSYLAEIGVDMEAASIMDDKDSDRLFKEAIDELPEQYKAIVDENDWGVKTFEGVMSLARAKGYTADEFKYNIVRNSDEEFLHLMTYDVWVRYNEKCRKANGIDFDDILVFTAHMLEREASVAEELSRRFKFLMLDEYQDTNPVQMRIMDAIAKYHQNIFVVGDEKQAIYGFRGSDVKVILGFISRYRNATLIGMTRNYRSNPLIIDCANAVATAMNQRVPNSDGQLIPQSSLPPLAPVFSEYENEKAEAYATIKAIQEDLRNGIPAKEIAVLYRSRNIKTAFEKALVQADIPYMLLGDTAFFQRAEVKDTVAFLKFVFQPWDSMAGLRVLGKISIGISSNKAKTAMQNEGLTVYDFLKRESEKRLKSTKKNGAAPYSKSALKAQAFLKPIEAIRQSYEYFDEPEDIVEALSEVWDIFYHPTLSKTAQKNASQQDTVDSKVENANYLLERLRDELKAGKTIEETIEELSLMVDTAPDLDRETDSKIRLMTMHASKGLEFHSCYIIGCDSEAISSKAEDDFDTIEENRRLLYVAITRAKTKLNISWCIDRIIFGNWTKVLPSPFITEILSSRNYPVN